MPTVNFQTISDDTWRIVLNNLPPENISCLHVSSTILFNICAKFILQGRERCQRTQNFQESQVDQTTLLLDSPCRSPDDLRRTFISDIKYRKRHNWDKFYTLTIDINALTPHEIALLIDYYKEYMSYRLLQTREGPRGFRHHITIHVGYKILSPFYNKTGINFKYVFLLLKSLEKTSEFLGLCSEDIIYRKRTSAVLTLKTQTRRRSNSVVDLRTKSEWL